MNVIDIDDFEEIFHRIPNPTSVWAVLQPHPCRVSASVPSPLIPNIHPKWKILVQTKAATISKSQTKRRYIDNFKRMKTPAAAKNTVYGQARPKYPAWLAFVNIPP
jgi:hypothetical protein